MAVIITVFMIFSGMIAYADADEIPASVPDGYTEAAENGNLRLFYSKKEAAIIVENKSTGHLWTSALDDGKMPADFTKAQVRETRSLLYLTYTSISDFSSKAKTGSLEDFNYDLKVIPKSDGFTYQIYIKELDCRIRISFVLDQYGLKVEIPKAGIDEAVHSSASIQQVRKELLDQVDAQKKALSTMRDASGMANDEKKKIDVSLKYLGRIETAARKLSDPYTAGGITDQILDYLDLMDKTAYKTPAMVPMKVTASKIKDADSAAIVSVDMMPYFGACADSEDGFFLYPDGSGAITRLKKKHSEFKSNYHADTYSSMTTDIDQELDQELNGLINMAMPYYGVRTGTDGFIAYVRNGQAMSDVTFSPSGYVMPISRTNAGFTYRMPVAASSKGGKWQSGSDTMVYESERTDYTAAIEYQFLQGNGSDYAGMANALRKFLTGEKLLTKSPLIRRQMPIAMDIFGASNDKYLCFNRYTVASKFSQASAVVDAVGSVPVLCNYQGITSKGYGVNPAGYRLNRKLGSQKELVQLADQIESGGGKLFIETNQLIADVGEHDYKESELAIGNQYTVLTNGESKTKFLLSPSAVNQRESDLIAQYGSYGKAAVMDSMIGKTIYPDYSKTGGQTRLQTVRRWEDNLEKSRSKLGAAAVSHGNDYALCRTDWITDAPFGSSGYSYEAEEVPFYELVTHGYIAETAGCFNEFYDKDVQMLKSIEYGLLPYFSITVNSLDKNVSGIYASRFNEIYKEMAEDYNECNRAIGDLVGVPITGHSRSGNLVTVTYGNGVQILINYSDHKIKSGSAVVEPKNYLRIKNGKVNYYDGKEMSVKKINVAAKGGTARIHVYSSLAVWIFAVLLVSASVFCGISFLKHRRHEKL